MSDELIQRAAALMREQADAYGRLDEACARLSDALVEGDPTTVESRVRVVEGELLRMRARLLQMMSALTSFSEARTRAPETHTLDAATRAAFDSSSREMLAAARAFRRTHERAAALANAGATYAAACIQTCGVQPTTYRAPYARRGEGRTWA